MSRARRQELEPDCPLGVPTTNRDDVRHSTGTEALDDVLHGWLLPHWTAAMRGRSGAGMALYGLQCLTPQKADDDSLLIAPEESLAMIRWYGAEHGGASVTVRVRVPSSTDVSSGDR